MEQALAEFTGRPRAILFSSGYLANLGVAAALVKRHDGVFQDRLNHASLVDAVLQTRARSRRYAHADSEFLARDLSSSRAEHNWVFTDGVFSMDGDLAPLSTMASVCRAAGAWLVVDDAHGIGVFGPEGRGTAAKFGLGPDDVPVLVGTFGKAFGLCGAFVAGSDILIDTLVQHARSLVYSTALPPAVAAAALESLSMIRDQPWRRDRLFSLIQRFRQGALQRGLRLLPAEGPIQPLVLGGAEQALRISQGLQKKGIFVPAIRPPTVPKGSARLRITLSALHTEQQVDRLLAALEELLCQGR